MQSYVVVLKGIMQYVLIIIVVFIIFLIKRIKYKKSNDYKLKRYFEKIALSISKIDTKNIYYNYCIRNKYIKKQKDNNIILTEKGLTFLEIIYNENNNYLTAFFTFTSLIISITAFVISISDLLIKFIESIKNIGG